MEKLVYLLWNPTEDRGDAWAESLLALGPDLRTGGALGLQVNVADTAVADALVRLTTFDRPVDAVVSVWVATASDVGRAGVEAVLSAPSVAGRLAGYLVTESVPLAPPSHHGRTPGFANVALLRRPEDLSPAQWLERWQGRHTEVALATQRTTGYIQNVVVRAVTPAAPPLAAVVEELFPIEALTDFHVFFDTGGDDAELGRRMTAMTDSVAGFGGDRVLDVVPTSRHLLLTPFADHPS